MTFNATDIDPETITPRTDAVQEGLAEGIRWQFQLQKLKERDE